MANNADDDVAAAIAAAWDAANLTGTIPGGLEQDRLTDSQPDAQPRKVRKLPYTALRVEKLKEPDWTSGVDYIDHRSVKLETRGLKVDVSAAVSLIRATFVQQTLPIVSANVVGGKAMAVLELPADELHKDSGVRQGEDIWLGTNLLHVMSHRQQPLALPPPAPPLPSPAPFDPRQTTSLQLWLDGADSSVLFQDVALTKPVSAINDPVKGWRDKGPFARNATSGTLPGGYKPNVANGRSAVVSNTLGTSPQLVLAAAKLLTGAFTLYAVGTSLPGALLFLTNESVAANPGFTFQVAGPSVLQIATDTSTNVSLTASLTGTVLFRFRRNSSNNCFIALTGLNEQSIGAATGTVTCSEIFGNTANGNTTDLGIGIGDLILYDQDKSGTADDSAVINYLAQKWGFSAFP